MIVVDASVAVKWIVLENGHEQAMAVLDTPELLIAPDFVILEVLNVLRRKLKKGEVVAEQVAAAADALPRFFDWLVPFPSLSRRALEMANRLDHAVYDCVYLACAIEFDGILVTADNAFARKAKQHGFSTLVAALSEAIELPTAPIDLMSSSYVDRAIKLYEAFERTRSFVRDSLLREAVHIAFLSADEYGPALGSPAKVALDRFVKQLSQPQRIHLLALGWLGQGYSGDDWDAIMARATAYLPDAEDRHLAYITSLFGYVSEGQRRLNVIAGNTSPDVRKS